MTAEEAQELIQQVKKLCLLHMYDEAIAKTNDLLDFDFNTAVKAHLLCIEHEYAWQLRKMTDRTNVNTK
jgi:hypothetical protein